MALLKGREMVFKAVESGTFLKPEQLEQSEQSSSDDKYTSLKWNNDLNTSSNELYTSFSSDSDIPLFTPKKVKWLKNLTPKQMLQRLPKVLAQVKAGNYLENLLNENRQIVYSLYQSKKITKKVCDKIIKSIQM